MDKAIFIPSAILGLFFIAIYSYKCFRDNKRFDHQVMVNTILQSSGIVCGVLLILSTFFVDLKQYLKNIDIYILISGLAVLVVSIQSVYSELFSKESNNKNNKETNTNANRVDAT